MSNPKKSSPPSWPRRMLEWYCGEAAVEDLLGDMDELFHNNLKKMSTSGAGIKYCAQSLVLLTSYAVRKRKQRHRDTTAYHSLAIYQSYSLIAFRSLMKYKVLSLISIICLSVGMSVGLLGLAAFVDMTEVDNFHSNAGNIYRVITHTNDGNEKETYASSSAPLPRQDFC